jgi:hypothetical protein|tara:strand:+ start:371 stop:754 length:384 start_codon:yes stop_codon:yes gene_type:complete
MDILKEQLLRAKELMGIINEQSQPTQKSRKELEKCFTDMTEKGKGGDWKDSGVKQTEDLYLHQISQPCWDNVAIPMLTSGENHESIMPGKPGTAENRKNFLTHCIGQERYKVIRLLTYLPEIQDCLK